MTNTNLTICFDLDGTLVDTAHDLIAALEHALQSKNLPKTDPAHIRPIIGEGAKAMITVALGSNSIKPTEAELDELWTIMIAHYQENLAVHSRAFENAINVIDELKSKGCKLAICTNKSMALTTPLLQALELEQMFDAITAGDSFAFKKPDPRHLWETVTQSGGTNTHAIMIGDSETDILAARNAKIPVIGVEWGYSKVPIHELEPDITIAHFNELHAAIDKLRA